MSERDFGPAALTRAHSATRLATRNAQPPGTQPAHPRRRLKDRIHEHLDDVARRLDRGDEDADLRQLLGEALDQLRAQSAATLQLARALQTFAELTATRLDAIAEEVDGTRRRAQGDS